MTATSISQGSRRAKRSRVKRRNWKEARNVLRRLDDEQARIYKQIPDEVDYVPHPSFVEAGAEERYGGEAGEIRVPRWTDFMDCSDGELPRVTGRSTLSAKDEAALFFRYNFARYRLSRLIDRQRARPTVGVAREMIRWHERIEQGRAGLVGANMALVLAMAKRSHIPGVELADLISEGNMALLRSVDKFDAGRGFKFSTYACRAILKGFHRLAAKTGRYRKHFPAEYDPEFDRDDYGERRHLEQRDHCVEAVRQVVVRNHAGLSETERTVIMARYAIGQAQRDKKKKTLAQVGQIVGLSNERVRQIQQQALDKVRTALSAAL